MEYIILYAIVGMVVGFLCGLFGLGGAIIVIPALAWIFALQGMSNVLIMHMAAGTSLAIMIFTSVSSLRGHIKHDV